MRVGTVCYATEQGLGRLAKSFYDAGIVTDVMVFRHPHGNRTTHTEWYPLGTPLLNQRPFRGEQVERFLDDLDVMLFFETPFDWGFADRCRERGIKTAIIPMHEWFPKKPPHQFDLFINPSLLDQEYFPQGEFIPIPVDKTKWSCRIDAKRFLHNAGHIGCRGHKGTLELLQAMQYVKSDIELHIRSQEIPGLKKLLQIAPTILQDERVTFGYGEIPYEKLFTGYDILIAPEKFNGLSLPLQEARASGMLVVTSDRFPHNTWLPRWPLIPIESYSKQSVDGGHLEFEEAIINPKAIAATIDMVYGMGLETYSLQGKAWAEGHSWDALKPRYLEALQGVLV